MNLDPRCPMERDGFLAQSPPHFVPPKISKEAASLKGMWVLLFVGGFFLAMGILLTTIFFPSHVVDEWRLRNGHSESTEGRIIETLNTKATENESPVYKFHYIYQPKNGVERKGVAYITAESWQEGRMLNVRYLVKDPAIAVPDGARMDVFSLFASFVVIFPIVGAAILIGSLRSYLGKRRLLRHGISSTATIASVQKTSMSINDEKVYKIHLTRTDDQRPMMKRSHDSDEITLAQNKLAAASLVTILYDPNQPNQFVFPEIWKL